MPREDKEKLVGRDEDQDCSDEEDEEKDKEKSVWGKSQDSFDEDGEKDEEEDKKSREEDEKSREEDEKSREEENKRKETSGQQGFTKRLLATSEKHRQLREQADLFYQRNAERMQQKYTKAKRKKVMTFSVGDFVSVRIPRIDRSSTDFHRVLCIVVEKVGQKFHLYRLRYAMHDAFYYTCD